MTGFSELAWQHVQPRYADIVAHPFVTGLGDGTLPHETFVRYLLDDARYLTSYARTLAVIASRMPDAAGVGLFAGFAAGAVVAERELHQSVLAPLGIDLDTVAAPAAPSARTAPSALTESAACTAYTGFLARTAAFAPVEVAAAAVLPCFRVYAEVGHLLVRQAREHSGTHPYAQWIDTYDAPEFAAAVASAEAAVDALAGASGHTEAMLAAYVTATEFEWQFWDAAWRG